jgi:threonine dehydratase
MASAADRLTQAHREGSDPTPDISLEDLYAAAKAIEGVAVQTPLLDAPPLASRLGVPVRLKCEQLQPMGAFKIRGAYAAISRIPASQRQSGVITYSSGNHGQAVAYAARVLGIPAVVVMPERAPAIKVEGVKRLGGEVVIAGNSTTERYEKARLMAEDRGLVMVPPYESREVIAGQGTCGLEVLQEWPAVETILVPVGGGGLIAGISSAVSALKRRVRIIGVEPVGAPKLARALEAGHPVQLESTASIADGLLPLSIGRIPWAVLAGVVHDSVLLTEDEIAEGVRYLSQQLALTAEPSGAVTTAALLSGKVRPTGPTVAILSGGNVDPHLLHSLVRQ